MKHTEEPWSSQGMMFFNNEATLILGKANDINNSLEQGYVNAERIVACVNACQGVSNEALKGGDIQGLIRFVRYHAEENKDLGAINLIASLELEASDNG